MHMAAKQKQIRGGEHLELINEGTDKKGEKG